METQTPETQTTLAERKGSITFVTRLALWNEMRIQALREGMNVADLAAKAFEAYLLVAEAKLSVEAK